IRDFHVTGVQTCALPISGSKDHNVQLRRRAQDRGLKLNEYGLFRGRRRIAGATEAEVFAALDLPWIAPELREDRGEIDAADRGRSEERRVGKEGREGWSA